jgi:CDGSH-type Zn-finger protein
MNGGVKKITVRPNGPYIVRGGIPLVRKTPVMSEHGEPLAWKKEDVISTGETYRLCRCGQSSTKPFCDGTHTMVGFDGDETADTSPIADRAVDHEGERIIVKDDRSLCMHAGFCGNRVTNIWKMVKETRDSQVRAELMAMVERCPSGALSYSLEAGGDTVEPDLAEEVSVIPDGPLWVSGGVPVERRDGQPLEARNRVTLCRCGASSRKPLCDGTHKKVGFSDAGSSA